MSTLIFRLRHVPDDEAQAVRELLDKHGIDWFETSAGNWGIAMPGLWVADEEQVQTARELINTYQSEHSSQQKELHEQQRRQGQQMTLLGVLLEHPLRTGGIILFCLFILYLSINPFLQMIHFSRQ